MVDKMTPNDYLAIWCVVAPLVSLAIVTVMIVMQNGKGG